MKNVVRRSPPVVQRIARRTVDIRRRRAEVSSNDLAQQVARLRRRVRELEQDVHENRRLNRRIAELADVVQELLLPNGEQDDQAIAERLARFHGTRATSSSGEHDESPSQSA